MSCSVYMIQSLRDKSFYVGISKDPFRRLKEHNIGKLKTTARKRPYQIVYVKNYPDYKLARNHEIWLKKKNIDYKLKIAQLAPPARGGVK